MSEDTNKPTGEVEAQPAAGEAAPIIPMPMTITSGPVARPPRLSLALAMVMGWFFAASAWLSGFGVSKKLAAVYHFVADYTAGVRQLLAVWAAKVGTYEAGWLARWWPSRAGFWPRVSRVLGYVTLGLLFWLSLVMAGHMLFPDRSTQVQSFVTQSIPGRDIFGPATRWWHDYWKAPAPAAKDCAPLPMPSAVEAAPPSGTLALTAPAAAVPVPAEAQPAMAAPAPAEAKEAPAAKVGPTVAVKPAKALRVHRRPRNKPSSDSVKMYTTLGGTIDSLFKDFAGLFN